MAEGNGTFNHANGDVYSGEFYHDRANGFGKFIHLSGQTYIGHWLNDLY